MTRTIPCVVLAAMAVGCKQESDFSNRQGSDTWRQAENDQVDILFVVDDSCSMEDEQATLAQGFASFADKLDDSRTRFHLGVISTSFDYGDPERGKLVGDPLYLTNDDADYVTAFAERAQLGIAGDDQERGLEAAAYAVSPIANLDLNDGFVRNDARMLMVFVSDEEDCSDGGALLLEDSEACYTERDQLTPVADFVEDFRSLKNSPLDFQATAIVGTADSACQNVYPSERYAEVAELTGGVANNICEGDWGAMLTELGLNASGVIASFQLTNAAQPETLEVYVDDTLVETGPSTWTYDEATWFVNFARVAIPPRGSVITANYTIASGAPRPPGVAADPNEEEPQ